MANDEERLTREGDEAGRGELNEGEMSEAEIDDNVMGSFPASDPLAWTLGMSPHRKLHSESEGSRKA